MIFDKEQVLSNLRYLQMLSQQYPTIQAASSEIINLQAILNLPKGTEHFMSDLHGEYEAFRHILNNASGSIREKIDMIYANTLPAHDRAVLATLIYYPQRKLEEIKHATADLHEWYRITLNRLIEVCRLVASKYTRSKVRKALPEEYSYIIDELLHNSYDAINKEKYYANIITTIIDIDRADDFIMALATTIKRLIVDHLHIVGDIFDRGSRADIVLDSLMEHHSVDIQWGNHDILWMGAAAGSRLCVANVLNNSITYNNLEVIETGYGISLRPLALFAKEQYSNVDTKCFLPKNPNDISYRRKDIELAAMMHKAIAIILFKLEGQAILRNPHFKMEERLLLDKINYDKGTITLKGKEYKLRDCSFPTVDRNDPYALTEEETELMEQLRFSFQRSEKLQKHIRFLYQKGSLYKCYNQNLLFHGCIPMNADGTLMEFDTPEGILSGKRFMDYCDNWARRGYYAQWGTPERQFGKDYLWFLWCGKNSPLFGREQITTFERLLIEDKETWVEPKNAYYTCLKTTRDCMNLLKEFGLSSNRSHIINGHVPVKSKEGENPVKCNGKLIVIDGGFCRAYQPTTGIAGYTLIYNSHGMRITSHEPFAGANNAIKNNTDILSTTNIFETVDSRMKVEETDQGQEIKQTIEDLKLLLAAYAHGLITEKHS